MRLSRCCCCCCFRLARKTSSSRSRVSASKKRREGRGPGRYPHRFRPLLWPPLPQSFKRGCRSGSVRSHTRSPTRLKKKRSPSRSSRLCFSLSRSIFCPFIFSFPLPFSTPPQVVLPVRTRTDPAIPSSGSASPKHHNWQKHKSSSTKDSLGTGSRRDRRQQDTLFHREEGALRRPRVSRAAESKPEPAGAALTACFGLEQPNVTTTKTQWPLRRVRKSMRGVFPVTEYLAAAQQQAGIGVLA
jgi:hypothetical protein